jgi:hypothetical protein
VSRMASNTAPPLRPWDFSGARWTLAPVLNCLGFDVYALPPYPSRLSEGGTDERKQTRDHNGGSCEGNACAMKLGASGTPIEHAVEQMAAAAQRHTRARMVLTPPGYRLSSLLKIVLTHRSYENVVEPGSKDLRREYIEAISGGHRRYAQWILVRGCFLIIWSLLSATSERHH